MASIGSSSAPHPGMFCILIWKSDSIESKHFKLEKKINHLYSHYLTSGFILCTVVFHKIISFVSKEENNNVKVASIWTFPEMIDNHEKEEEDKVSSITFWYNNFILVIRKMEKANIQFISYLCHTFLYLIIKINKNVDSG